MAGVTRLELATSCVTGMRSNQLSYTPSEKNRKEKTTMQKIHNAKINAEPKGPASRSSQSEGWWVMTGSNCRPSPCKGDALPTELITRKIYRVKIIKLKKPPNKRDKHNNYQL